MRVEVAPGEGVQHAHHDGAGQDGQARHRGRLPLDVLHEQRHHDRRRHERDMREHDERGRHGERPIPEARQLQQRILDAQLPADEHADQHQPADKRHEGGGPDTALGFERRGAHHHGDETDEVQQGRGRVEFAGLVGAAHHVGQQRGGEHDDGDGDGTQNPEHRSPTPGIDEETADGRPDGGRKPDDHADDARRAAVLAFRVDVQRHQLHERKADARASRLQQARGEQQRVVRRENRRGASDGEAGHGGEEEVLRIETVHQKRRQGADEAEREDIGRREQLARGSADGVFAHDRGERRDEHRLRDA